ncbi:hypothetical protein ACFL2V_03275 [Pseudomonadota bacterium]
MKFQGKPKGSKSLRVIRNVYLYLVAMIGLVVFVIGSIGIIDNILQNYVFQVDSFTYYRAPLGYDACTRSYVAPEGGQVERSEEEIAKCEAKYDEYNEKEAKNEVKKDFAISIAQLLVGLPLWLFHWGIIQREYRRKKKE